tara:strand:+ start:3029 stop:3232 length:204 start_codon:yes stop_codon:yes gene_type:complete
MFFNMLAFLAALSGCPFPLDKDRIIAQYPSYDSPLAGSLSWLLPGAGKPPSGRFSHFWGSTFYRGFA